MPVVYMSPIPEHARRGLQPVFHRVEQCDQRDDDVQQGTSRQRIKGDGEIRRDAVPAYHCPKNGRPAGQQSQQEDVFQAHRSLFDRPHDAEAFRPVV